MLTLNIEFQEEYKHLDRLLKDRFESETGVSEYIERMDFSPWYERGENDAWDADYRKLKHARWLRNRLAHDYGTLNSDLCSEKDLAFLKDFYNRCLAGADALAEIQEAQDEALRRWQERKKERLLRQQKNRTGGFFTWVRNLFSKPDKKTGKENAEQQSK